MELFWYTGLGDHKANSELGWCRWSSPARPIMWTLLSIFELSRRYLLYVHSYNPIIIVSFFSAFVRYNTKFSANYVFPSGSLVKGLGVARVLESNNPKFNNGDLVWGMTGWEQLNINIDLEIEGEGGGSGESNEAKYGVGVESSSAEFGGPGLAA
ncbi:hypothetical protein ACH5RR_011437 [Cinchona calisaya]|uniref:Oxidoreductase N-terminal domain-containing protein n=1 Tax=Cinchona calisaya TaxID=153742 RepID=A0ABD3A7D6_9GENT